MSDNHDDDVDVDDDDDDDDIDAENVCRSEYCWCESNCRYLVVRTLALDSSLHSALAYRSKNYCIWTFSSLNDMVLHSLFKYFVKKQSTKTIFSSIHIFSYHSDFIVFVCFCFFFCC